MPMNTKSPSTQRKPNRRRGSHRLEERAAALFVLGIVLFSPLVVHIFDRGAEVALWGIPLLYVYAFAAWALLIALLALVVEASAISGQPDPPPGSDPGSGPGSGPGSDPGPDSVLSSSAPAEAATEARPMRPHSLRRPSQS